MPSDKGSKQVPGSCWRSSIRWVGAVVKSPRSFATSASRPAGRAATSTGLGVVVGSAVRESSSRPARWQRRQRRRGSQRSKVANRARLAPSIRRASASRVGSARGSPVALAPGALGRRGTQGPGGPAQRAPSHGPAVTGKPRSNPRMGHDNAGSVDGDGFDMGRNATMAYRVVPRRLWQDVAQVDPVAGTGRPRANE